MGASSFTGLAIVAAVAFAVPLVLGLAPRLRLPAVVAEIIAGIVIGPAGLRWVQVDAPIAVLSLLGLVFLLFLAGLEIDFKRLRGRVLRVTGLGFALSLALALPLGFGFGALGMVHSPLLVAIILAATALGIVLPVLKDAGEASSAFGQLVIAGATIAEFGTIILLALFFSRAAHGIGAQLVLLGELALLALVIALVILRVERMGRLTAVLLRLQDTTDQIRIRGAFLLLAVFAALAERLGLEVILGAFLAGALLTLVDGDQKLTHPRFHAKLEAIGYGVFVPFFFVTSGLRFDLAALTASPATVARVPVFLAALLVVRGAPALLYRPLVGGRRTIVAGLLQATTLTFIVAATQIGQALGLMGAATAAALIAAGLLSVLLFPLVALTLLQRAGQAAAGAPSVALAPDRPVQTDG
jgi:Kef-type K+ transport system membrane component KefB